MNRDGIYALRQGKVLFFSVKGLGSMHNSRPMYELIRESLEDKVSNEIYIDLSNCSGMDSTFMGTLLLSYEETTDAGGKFALVGVTDYGTVKLEELGVSEFIPISSEEVDIPNEASLDRLPGPDEDMTGKMSHILRSHEQLIKKQPKLEKEFGSMISYLKKDLENKGIGT